MTALAIIAVAVAVMAFIGAVIAATFWARATQAEADHQRALQEEANAKRQEAYAKIATDGRSVDDTAGVLDEGRFFLPSDQDLHPRGAAHRFGGNPCGQKPDAE